MIIRCTDVETSGLSPTEHSVCELAYCDLGNESGDWKVAGGQSWFCDPGHPISPEASAIHHIIDEDVAGQPPYQERCRELVERHLPNGEDIVAFAAHNNRFDCQWLTEELIGKRHWVDTYRCALWLWPEAPGHSLHALRYWLKPEGLDRAIATSHRAYGDAYTAAFLVREMLKKTSGKQLVVWSSNPALLPRFTFGEHAMKPVALVPTSYLEWILKPKKDPFDEDVLFTVNHELDRREAAWRREQQDKAAEQDMNQAEPA